MADYNKLVDKFFESEENLNVKSFNNLINNLLNEIISEQISVDDLNKLIREQALTQKQNEDEYEYLVVKEKILPAPAADAGIAIEYYLGIELSKHFKSQNGEPLPLYYHSSDLSDRKGILINNLEKFEKQIQQFSGFSLDKEKQQFTYKRKKGKKVDLDSAKKESQKYFTAFINDKHYQNMMAKKNPIAINLVGETLRGESSADIEIQLQESDPIRLSIKRGAGASTFYKSGGTPELSPPALQNIPSLKQKGGGVWKVYKIFGVQLPTAMKDINTVFEDLSVKLQQKYSTNPSDFIKILSTIITRQDPNVKALSLVKTKKTIFVDLLITFLGHIKEITFFYKKTSENITSSFGEIKVKLICEKFSVSSNQTDIEDKFGKTIQKELNQEVFLAEQEYKKFYITYNESEEFKKEKNVKNVLAAIGVKAPLPEDFNKFLTEFQDFINKKINNINKSELLSIVAMRQNNISYDTRLEKRAGLTNLHDLSSTFTYLESDEKFKFLTETIKKLMSVSTEIIKLRNQINAQKKP